VVRFGGDVCVCCKGMVRRNRAHPVCRQHCRGPVGLRQTGRQKTSHYGINLIDPG